jgi:hypothetical protein
MGVFNVQKTAGRCNLPLHIWVKGHCGSTCPLLDSQLGFINAAILALEWAAHEGHQVLLHVKSMVDVEESIIGGRYIEIGLAEDKGRI